MPVYDPSTHDDLIDISINLATPNRGRATFSTVAIFQADVTPGGGLFLEYGSSLEVAADVTAGNLTALSQRYDEAKATAAALGIGFVPAASPGFNDRAVRSELMEFHVGI